MTVNKKRTVPLQVEKMKAEAHVNFMGAPAYDIKNPLFRLRCVAASSFFGEPSYYKDAGVIGTKRARTNIYARRSALTESDTKNLRKMLNAIDDYEWRNLSTKETMERCIDEALAYDPEATLQLAVELRKVDMIRTTPQVIMVRAANHKALKGTGLVRKYASQIIQRADEPSVQLAYQISEFGKPVPNSLKRSWADFLLKASPYQLAKYRMESRMVKTVDVGNIAYGKGFYGFQGPVGELMRGELKLGGDNETWESIISAGGDWFEAFKVMGHMALLRNLRNLLQHGINPKAMIDKLVKTAKDGKQLPFRYWTAHRELQNIAPGGVLDAIEECLEISLENVPFIGGRSLVLVDNSGSTHSAPISSMSSTAVYEIGNLMGVLTGLRSDDGVIGAFGDKLMKYNIRKRASVFDQVAAVNDIGRKVGPGTENGIWLALHEAIVDKEHYDTIFVYSDMQAGHGGLYGKGAIPREYVWNKRVGNPYIDVPSMVTKYRQNVNPNVFVFLVQIAGYEDTLLPEYYDKTFILGGWSGRILDFAAKMRGLFSN